MTYTCSFHHGTEIAVAHNRRTIQGEAHIDTDKKHESWIDEDIEKAYQRIFGKALQEYNDRQKRSDRKIKSYLQNVRQNSKLKEAYEFIVQVGNEKSHPDEAVSRKILVQYLAEFRRRNKGLEIIGAYYHADEYGGCPHLHVDYIPTAPNKKTGLKLKNNLTEALKKLGYETEYVEDTERGINKKTGKPYTKMVSAEMKFQEAERSFLEQACRHCGLDIQNPRKNKDEYMTSKEIRRNRDLRIQNEVTLAVIEEKTKAYDQARQLAENKIQESKTKIKELQDEYQKSYDREKILSEKRHEIDEKKHQLYLKEQELEKRENTVIDAENGLSERVFDANSQIIQANKEMEHFYEVQNEVINTHNFQIRANKSVLEMMANNSYNEKSDSKQLFGGLKTLAKGFIELKQKIQTVLHAPLAKVEEWCRKAREKGCSNLEEYLFPTPNREVKKINTVEVKKETDISRGGR